MKRLNIAIVGATGAVGQEILKVMAEREISFNKLRLLSSERSAGTVMKYDDRQYIVEETTEKSFDGIDLALFAGGPASKAFGRLAQQKGTVVIDNSSTFRLEQDVPLVVPEVNPQALFKHQGLIANPNCSTIIMVVALYPIYKLSRIKRIIVSTYQAVSGAGKEGIEELTIQTKQLMEGKTIETKIFPYQIASNLIPHIDVWMEENYTKEEMKMVYETHKIIGDFDIGVTATTVRVPIYRSHSESIYIETEDALSLDAVRKTLVDSKGVVVQDDPSRNIYPMPLFASYTDEVYVGRIRKDLYNPKGLNMWVVSDQIRKGAATNAVQIAEELLKNNLV
ncbi:MAG: aspartate-semialdehyde dehydrogenase [Bacillota bacterium]